MSLEKAALFTLYIQNRSLKPKIIDITKPVIKYGIGHIGKMEFEDVTFYNHSVCHYDLNVMHKE